MCHYQGTKSTEMGQLRLFTCPHFVQCLMYILVIQTVLQIDRMDKGSIPKYCTQPSTVENTAYQRTITLNVPLGRSTLPFSDAASERVGSMAYHADAAISRN
jgi:hypothetical protein